MRSPGLVYLHGGVREPLGDVAYPPCVVEVDVGYEDVREVLRTDTERVQCLRQGVCGRGGARLDDRRGEGLDQIGRR